MTKLSAKEIYQLFKTFKDRLSKKEQDILNKYYGFDDFCRHTLQEIGNELGVTRERIRQVRENAVRKLKKYSQQ